MPFPNEHAARIKDPGKYKRFRRQKNKGGQGVDFIFGITTEGKTEVQAVRFSKNVFTIPEAKKWLKEHKMTAKLFEPAKKTDNNDEYIVEEFRYDKGEVRNAHFDEDGFLVADAIITRTGVFNYRNSDGSLRRELRHPDDVLTQLSLSTLKMLPITLLHPPEKKVDTMNASRLSKGFTGEDVRPDGKFIKNKLKICDQEAINAVIGGMQELSLGYVVALVEEDGEYMGERYDFRQTEIVYNHLAIVPSARAGNEARIVLDESDAVQCMTEDKEDCSGACDGDCKCSNAKDLLSVEVKYDSTETEDTTNHQPTNKENRMKKVNIDGIEYDAAPEVANKLTKESARADKAETDLTTANTEKTEIQAKLDEANDKLKKFEDRDDAAEIQKGVDARLKLIAAATPHLDEETMKKVNDMSEKEIKTAVIKKHYPDVNLDEKDDVYINARFDGAIELEPERKDENSASQRKQMSGVPAGKAHKHDNREEPDQDKSRNDMVSGLKDAWKTEKKTGTDD
jgi:hypothetical protein